jgi:hypothetical protein
MKEPKKILVIPDDRERISPRLFSDNKETVLVIRKSKGLLWKMGSQFGLDSRSSWMAAGDGEDQSQEEMTQSQWGSRKVGR